MHYNENTQCFYSVNFGASQGAWEREMAVSPLSAVGICVSVCLCYELFLASSSHGR